MTFLTRIFFTYAVDSSTKVYRNVIISEDHGDKLVNRLGESNNRYVDIIKKAHPELVDFEIVIIRPESINEEDCTSIIGKEFF